MRIPEDECHHLDHLTPGFSSGCYPREALTPESALMRYCVGFLILLVH